MISNLTSAATRQISSQPGSPFSASLLIERVCKVAFLCFLLLLAIAIYRAPPLPRPAKPSPPPPQPPQLGPPQPAALSSATAPDALTQAAQSSSSLTPVEITSNSPSPPQQESQPAPLSSASAVDALSQAAQSSSSLIPVEITSTSPSPPQQESQPAPLSSASAADALSQTAQSSSSLVSKQQQPSASSTSHEESLPAQQAASAAARQIRVEEPDPFDPKFVPHIHQIVFLLATAAWNTIIPDVGANHKVLLDLGESINPAHPFHFLASIAMHEEPKEHIIFIHSEHLKLLSPSYKFRWTKFLDGVQSGMLREKGSIENHISAFAIQLKKDEQELRGHIERAYQDGKWEAFVKFAMGIP